MGGGGGKPLNVFRLGNSLADEPREVLNWRLWFAVFSFGIMGAARGGELSRSSLQLSQSPQIHSSVNVPMLTKIQSMKD